MRLISKFMSEKGLNKETQNRIKKYLEFYLGKENAMRTEGNDVMHFLSESLKDELVKEVNAKILDDCKFFSINFRKKFLYAVSHLIEEQSYGPEEFIFRYEELDDQAIYFITSGKILMLYEKCNFKVKKLGRNDTFGTIEFFSGQPRLISAKSLEFSTVFVLPRKVFTDKLQEYPLDKESYQQIYDSINIYGTYKYLDIPCLACGKLDHLILHCPSTHSKMNKLKIIQNFIREEKNYRRKFVRKPIRKFHYEKDYEIIQEAITRIQIDHQDELNEIDHANIYDEEEDDFLSDTDEVLDRNFYSPPQIIYTDDSGAERIFNPENNKYWQRRNYRKPTFTKGDKRKADDIDLFVQKNYHPLYQNINIDMVWNFELYYPNNNINKIARDLEKERFKKLLRMRVGDKAERMFPLLSKAFRLFEHRRPEEKHDGKPMSPLKRKQTMMKMSGPRRDSKFQFRPPEPLPDFREFGASRAITISNNPSMLNEVSVREGSSNKFNDSRLVEGKVIEIKPIGSYFSDPEQPPVTVNERRKSKFFQPGQDISIRTQTQSALPNSTAQPSPNLPLNLHLQRVVASQHVNLRKLSVFSRRSNREQFQTSSSSDSDQSFSEINNSLLIDQQRRPSKKFNFDRRKSVNSRKHSSILDESMIMNSFRNRNEDVGIKKLKFEHANVMEKFTQKLGENKTQNTEYGGAYFTGNYITTENGLNNSMYRIPVRLTQKGSEARKKIYENQDLTRKIVFEKAKEKPKRAISLDDHKNVTKVLNDLNIDRVLNVRR